MRNIFIRFVIIFAFVTGYADSFKLDTFKLLQIYHDSQIAESSIDTIQSIKVVLESYSISEGMVEFFLQIKNCSKQKYVYFKKSNSIRSIVGFGGVAVYFDGDIEKFSYQVSPSDEYFYPVILERYQLDSTARVDRVRLTISLEALRQSLILSGLNSQSMKSAALQPFVTFIELTEYLKLDPEKEIFSTSVMDICADEKIVISNVD